MSELPDIFHLINEFNKNYTCNPDTTNSNDNNTTLNDIFFKPYCVTIDTQVNTAFVESNTLVNEISDTNDQRHIATDTDTTLNTENIQLDTVNSSPLSTLEVSLPSPLSIIQPSSEDIVKWIETYNNTPTHTQSVSLTQKNSTLKTNEDIVSSAIHLAGIPCNIQSNDHVSLYLLLLPV